MRLVVVISSLALVVATGAQATTARGTLVGTVTRGPIAPVCGVEQPCDEPAANVALVFSRGQELRGRVTTDRDGRYRIRLPVGTYVVRRAVATAPDRKLDPSSVRVRAGRLTRVDFSIDTGIR
jgi:hypothetical protein